MEEHGGYDAQRAKCASEELDQINSGLISKYKVMCLCGVREENGDKVYEDEVSDPER